MIVLGLALSPFGPLIGDVFSQFCSFLRERVSLSCNIVQLGAQFFRDISWLNAKSLEMLSLRECNLESVPMNFRAFLERAGKELRSVVLWGACFNDDGEYAADAIGRLGHLTIRTTKRNHILGGHRWSDC